MRDSPPLYLLVRRLFSPMVCKEIIQYCERDNGSHWAVNADFKEGAPTQLIPIHNGNQLIGDVANRLRDSANCFTDLLGIDVDDLFSDIQITKWQPGQQMGKHHDCEMLRRSVAKDTKITIYVSLSHLGGLEMEKDGFITCREGDGIIFNAFTKHAVSDRRIIERYSMLAWMHGPRWR